MKFFRCRACHKEVKRGEIQCPDCASRDIAEVIVSIIFHKDGIPYPVVAHKTMVLGRNEFRAYGESYKFLEKNQFEVIQSDTSWQIKGFSTTNPTLVNGVDITNKVVNLNDGDKIKVGNFEVTAKFIETEIGGRVK